MININELIIRMETFIDGGKADMKKLDDQGVKYRVTEEFQLLVDSLPVLKMRSEDFQITTGKAELPLTKADADSGIKAYDQFCEALNNARVTFAQVTTGQQFYDALTALGVFIDVIEKLVKDLEVK